MVSGNKGRDDSSSYNNDPLSDQSRMISQALKQADEAMDQVGYGEASNSSQEMSTVETCIEAHPDETLAETTGTLNLKGNDTQFQVLAELVVAKYDRYLKNGAKSFAVSIKDKEQFDRMVNRQSFVEAVRYRLMSCPETSLLPLHVLLRKCRFLGLHRSGDQNLLYAPAGTLIQIEQASAHDEDTMHNEDHATIATGYATKYTDGEETVGRQQLLAELREATKLLADSVTPEASRFWNKHVIELQTRLKDLEKSGQRKQERIDTDDNMLPVLCKNTNYVPPSREELSQYQPPDSKSSQPSTNEMDPEVQGLPIVDVIAPANLPEGYTFEAEMEGCRFMATVPAGGVRKGQTFTCYMRDIQDDSSEILNQKWRDGLFDCFKFGAMHPMALNSLICPLLGLGQVMARMGVDILGLPARGVPKIGFWSTRGMTVTLVAFWVFLNLVTLGTLHYKRVHDIPISSPDVVAAFLMNLVMYGYAVYATANTRATLRDRYRIQHFCCGEDKEDFICAAACMPCVVAQMGRHTVSYNHYQGVCCSNTGLEPGVEAELTSRNHHGTYRVW